MKANELMIGDWVNSTIEGKGKVTRIERDGFIAITYGNMPNAVVCKSYDLIPIPLTTEILQANGFDCSDEEVVRYNFTDGDYQGHFSLRRMYSGNTPKGWSFFAFNVLTIIDYVHELQHALKLCGIDKDIQL